MADIAARDLPMTPAGLDAVTQAIVRDALVDRDLGRRIAHEAVVRAELARVAGSVHARTCVGDRLERELSLSASYARTRIGDAVRARLDEAREALVERANEIDTLALETATARRSLVTGDTTLGDDGPAHEREVIASEGVEYWPFDGEYWADEVTSYRVVLHDHCGR
jgi:hypothetical protein